MGMLGAYLSLASADTPKDPNCSLGPVPTCTVDDQFYTYQCTSQGTWKNQGSTCSTTNYYSSESYQPNAQVCSASVPRDITCKSPNETTTIGDQLWIDNNQD